MSLESWESRSPNQPPPLPFAPETLAQPGEFNARDLAEHMETKVFQNIGLLQDFANLTDKLKERLADYDLVLSDDSSGRLPSLVFKKLVDSVRVSQGRGKSDIYFLAAGRHGRDSADATFGAIADFVSSKHPAGRKALLVTEFIQTGASMISLVEALKKAGVDFDLAALSICHAPSKYPTAITERMVYGAVSSSGLEGFFQQSGYSGVHKKKSEDLISPHPTRSTKASQRDIQAARRDVDRLVEALQARVRRIGAKT